MDHWLADHRVDQEAAKPLEVLSDIRQGVGDAFACSGRAASASSVNSGMARVPARGQSGITRQRIELADRVSHGRPASGAAMRLWDSFLERVLAGELDSEPGLPARDQGAIAA